MKKGIDYYQFFLFNQKESTLSNYLFKIKYNYRGELWIIN